MKRRVLYSRILAWFLCAAVISFSATPVFAEEESGTAEEVQVISEPAEPEPPAAEEIPPAVEEPPETGGSAEETDPAPVSDEFPAENSDDTSYAEPEIIAEDSSSGDAGLLPETQEVPAGTSETTSEEQTVKEEPEKNTEIESKEEDKDKEEEKEDEEKEEEEEGPTGEEVAESIREIVEATGEMALADANGLERLQEYIAETQEAFDNLTEEEQGALSESISYLDTASGAVDSMQEALEQVAETGTLVIEQTGLPNSWRYLNGELITEIVETIDAETEEVAAIEPEEEPEEKTEGETAAEEPAVQELTEPENAAAPEENAAAEEMPAEAPEASPEQTESSPEPVQEETAVSELTSLKIPAGMEPAQARLVALGSNKQGIDISQWNGSINWNEVKAAGIDFVIIRCGYGENNTSQDDKYWAANVAACEQYGIPYGVYLYSYATSESQIDSEVQHVLRLLQGHKPTLPVYLDLEENDQAALGNAKISNMALRFCSQIQAAGYKTGVYANLNWYNNYIVNFASNGNYWHWVAQYPSREKYYDNRWPVGNAVVETCAYGGRYETWQYASNGQIGSMTCRFDLNLWYGTFPSGSTNSGGSGSSGGSGNTGSTGNTVSSGNTYTGSLKTAAPVSGHTYELVCAKDTRFALDVAGGSFMPKANVRIYRRNSTEGQAFTLTKLSDGTWRIRNYKGMTLDVYGGSKSDKANIWTYDWNGSAAQKFKLQKNTDGTYTFLNAGSGKALDVSGGKMQNTQNVWQYKSNKTIAQKWVLVDVSSRMTKKTYEGTKRIASTINTKYVLDIYGGSTQNMANLQLYRSNGTDAQAFVFTYRGNGFYSIKNKKSGKVLDVRGGRAQPDTNVWQYTWNGSKAQLWQVVKNADGTYTFHSALNTNLVLDVDSGIAANKENVQIYWENYVKDQKWMLISVS